MKTSAQLRGLSVFSDDQLNHAHISYAARRVPREAMAFLLAGDLRPCAGDLVLARIERLGQHKHIELETGRRAALYVGDEVIVCYGNRYAPDQFEATVPGDLGECNLVAGGGIAARVLSRHARMKNATTIKPLALLGDRKGYPINLSAWAVKEPAKPEKRPPTIAVVGSSMNAGKTTTAASLIHGFVKSGFKVGAAKITGTGAGCDRWSMLDAGAAMVVDFTDAGFASTYLLSASQVESILTKLTNHLAANDVDLIVLEVADGLFQQETEALLVSPAFKRCVDEVIFAASDAMGALAGVEWLRRNGLQVPAVSGLLTTSPLAIREAAAATGLPVLTRLELCDGRWHGASHTAGGIGAYSAEPARARAVGM